MFRSIYKLLSFFLSKKKIHLTKGPNYLGRNTLIQLNKFDFVRIATLELIAHEIKEGAIKGNVAELGVYKGGFAKYINEVFSERTFYLFDTFSGFNATDISKEESVGINYTHQDFSDTSPKAVLQKMPFPEKCVIQQGYFPETYKGLEDENFCFVSIDADLYEPILNGLKVFYSNLSTGGYIMVHDYNNAHYEGCKKAVKEFCGSLQIPYVPIPDSGGTVVIKKP